MASGSFGTFMSGIGATIKTTTFKVGTALGLTAAAIAKSTSRAYKNFKQKVSDKMAEAGSSMQNRAVDAEKKRQQKVATKKAEQAARDEVAAAARENAHKVSEDKITHGQEESQQRQGHIEESGKKQRERVEDSKKKKVERGEQETAATIDEQ
ncbi:MAG: hypothetical protein IKB06_02475, partial [Clostridia bacterium]|nr:hypothetical protein [Clostridia bacterium]